jgi:hypothetical protein
MAVMAREAWTDHRLDDLNHKVDAGFAELREDNREIRRELGALNRVIHQFIFAMVGTVLLGFIGTIAAILTLV